MGQNRFFKILFLFIFFSTTNFVAQNKSVDLKTIWENTKNADTTRFNAIDKFYFNNSFEQPDSILKIANYHYYLAKEKKALIEMTNSLTQKYRAYYKKGNASITRKLYINKKA